MQEYVFIYRLNTQGHGEDNSHAVRATNPGEAWEAFHEAHPNTVWARIQNVRKPLWS